MYYRYQPYPYYRRYYNINPYYYRPYIPYYNYQQNIIDSQIANVDQRIDNYGYMNDVIQNSDIYQSMSSVPKPVGVCTLCPEPILPPQPEVDDSVPPPPEPPVEPIVPPEPPIFVPV